MNALQSTVTELQSKLADQAKALEQAQTQVEARIPDLAPLEQRLTQLDDSSSAANAAMAGISGDVKSISDGLADLDSRLTALEKRPVEDNVSREAIAAYEREMSSLTDRVGGIRAEVEALLEDAKSYEASARDQRDAAESSALEAEKLSAVALLRATAASGAPFASEGAAVSALGIAVPAAVTEAAEAGVASLASLTDAFPDAARAALVAAREETKGTGGLSGYLQRQFGARSVAPRDGDDPDAVLSRAEAAVQSGDVAGAVDLIGTLPEAAQTVLGTWVSEANTRLAVLAAIDGLAPTQNSN